ESRRAEERVPDGGVLRAIERRDERDREREERHGEEPDDRRDARALDGAEQDDPPSRAEPLEKRLVRRVHQLSTAYVATFTANRIAAARLSAGSSWTPSSSIPLPMSQ